MASKHLNKFPKPLLDDLVAKSLAANSSGAGFSRNAVLPLKKKVPLSNEPGRPTKADLRDYSPSALSMLSPGIRARIKARQLIERLSELLHVNEARPGEAHKAFCSIQFDIVCTTNFDFLLERQYDLIPRQCTPLIDEEQLAVKLNESGTALLETAR